MQLTSRVSTPSMEKRQQLSALGRHVITAEKLRTHPLTPLLTPPSVPGVEVLLLLHVGGVAVDVGAMLAEEADCARA